MNKEKEVNILDVYIVIRNFIKRRWLWLLIAGILGAVFGYVKVKLQDNAYRSDIVIRSGLISKDQIYTALLPIVNNTEEKPVKKLTRFFETGDKTFASVQKFAIDTLDIKSGIVIHLHLTDTSDLADIQAEFHDFFINRSGFTKLFEKEKALNEEYYNVLSEEIAEINAFQEKILEADRPMENASQSLAGTHEELIDLYEKYLKVKRDLEMKSPVSVTFSKDVMPIQKHPLRKMTVYSLIFGLIMLFLLILAEFERAARQRRNSE